MTCKKCKGKKVIAVFHPQKNRDDLTIDDCTELEKSCEGCTYNLTAYNAEYEGKKLPSICFNCGDDFSNFTRKKENEL